ncbi:MAG TPA: cation-translocating P-type ATPase [Verrucomicrobiota bacterium]|nr:cation-translocating P-type ATPase [Verrucomicrobiota bacterium]
MSAFQVRGMTCGNCARHVREAVQELACVQSVGVDLDPGEARVAWRDPARADATAVIRAIEKAGFSAAAKEDKSTSPPAGWSPLRGWRFNVYCGLIALAPLLWGEWIAGWSEASWFRWLGFVLATPVQILCGARFYVGAWNRLKSGGSNMDTLVVLGSTTAYLFSAWVMFSGFSGHLFFLESVAIITLISIGHWLESLATSKAARAIGSLLDLAPPKARRLDLNHQEIEVDVRQLVPGDRVVLRPGDRIPVDGKVIQGGSAVDESMLTGESMPVDKETGSILYAGTLNQSGRLIMETMATGSDTALARIVEAVRHCQNSRARIQRLGDQVSNVFVPAVILIAVLAGLWWGWFPETARQATSALEPWLWRSHLPADPLSAAIMVSAGVLIVACPCAMGLATPAALMVGAQTSARRGILIRDGIALEKCGNIQELIFDKTGTLTAGRMEVVEHRCFIPEEQIPARFLDLASSMAEPSSHPISKAIARLSRNRLPLGEWQEHRGLGLSARILEALAGIPAGTHLRFGSLSWLGAAGVDLGLAKSWASGWQSQGATVVGLASEKRLVSVYALQDPPKPQAASVVALLKSSGLEVGLLTGDQEVTAAVIGKRVGIVETKIHAAVHPDKKAEMIRSLQEQGRRVAFVGDGINDAPALEQADLGIAVGQASDIARESADVILLNSDIQAVPEALALARRVLRTIRQNLFWAFFYNAAAIPLTALGFLSPVICAAAMGMSDLIVIGNSLRLGRWRPPEKPGQIRSVSVQSPKRPD